MTKDLQLGIPTPCSENWSNMSPEASGRFCSACQKTVLDFTAIADDEILQWFASHQGYQMNTAIFRSPPTEYHSKTRCL